MFDLITYTKYKNTDKNSNYTTKLYAYAIFKYFAILLWIFSWKVDTSFFVIYSTLFYLYFPINLIVRIATKGKQSIIFYLLDLKNV